MSTVKTLIELLRTHKVEKIFLVSGKKSYGLSGAKKILGPILKKYKVLNFTDFSPNPKIQDVKKGVDLFRVFSPDIVIAVGGGSVIDTAKSINALALQDGDLEDYILKKKEIKIPGKVLVAIPTTCGTGSESTCFSVVYIGKVKHSLKHTFILPSYAIIDPQFTFSLSAKITAETGADAFVQAIESYWSVNSTVESKKYAAKAIKIILKNITGAVNDSDQWKRLEMCRAANFSGKAINITETTACHAISYPLTSYFGIPHGQAVAITLTSVLNHNSLVSSEDLVDKRGVRYVKHAIKEIEILLGVNDRQAAEVKIENIFKSIGLSTKFHELGLSVKDLKFVLDKNYSSERMKNNPRQMTKKQLRNIMINLI